MAGTVACPFVIIDFQKFSNTCPRVVPGVCSKPSDLKSHMSIRIRLMGEYFVYQRGSRCWFSIVGAIKIERSATFHHIIIVGFELRCVHFSRIPFYGDDGKTVLSGTGNDSGRPYQIGSRFVNTNWFWLHHPYHVAHLELGSRFDLPIMPILCLLMTLAQICCHQLFNSLDMIEVILGFRAVALWSIWNPI